MSESTYRMLLNMLHASNAQYRLLDHPAEGETRAASLLRKHPVAQAAKSLVIRVAVSRRRGLYVLAVVPGDRYVDLGRLCALTDGISAAFAERTVAERLSGTVSGSIPPLSFHPELSLIVDAGLLEHEVIYFNAARLDRSIAIATPDYLALARPRVERFSSESVARPASGAKEPTWTRNCALPTSIPV